MRCRARGRAALVWVALAAWACSEQAQVPALEPGPASVRTTRQEANSTRKVLILGSTIAGGLQSQEARAVAALPAPSTQPWAVDVVTPAQWKAMTAEQFMSYRALVIGDAACIEGTAAWQAALDTRDTWGAIVDGKIFVIGSNVASNSWSAQSGEVDPVVQGGIALATERTFLTGMYVSLGCAYRSAPAGTVVDLLSPFGTFKVAGTGCTAMGHIPSQYPAPFPQGTFDGALSGVDECSAKSVFFDYPRNDFSISALALQDPDTTMPGADTFLDYDLGENFTGTPFILTRGTTAVGFGCGGLPEDQPPGEECDLGDGGNGQPASGTPPEVTCSWTCKSTWCGDGVIQPELGELCDNGAYNGRDFSGNIANGMCTRMCRIVAIPDPNRAPVAKCKNASVTVTNTCGGFSSINDGSFDPDPVDTVTCTQTPGSYAYGNTTATLTCTDSRGKSASCTATVSVVDQTAPELTLAGSTSMSLQCGVDTYSEPGATATDVCDGAPTIATTITRDGTAVPAVNNTPQGVYEVSYTAKDTANNTSAAQTRTVTVIDTSAPVLALNGPAVLGLECGTAYNEQGATANDACAGDLTGNIQTTGPVNSGVAGTYTRTYRVTDPSGQSAQATRTVEVSDTQAPSLALVGSATQLVECNGQYADPGARAADLCNGDLTASIEKSGTVDPAVLGNYTVRYNVKDLSNNAAAELTRAVTVQDRLVPEIIVNGPLSQQYECGSAYMDPGATANDQCAGDLTAAIEATRTGNPTAPGNFSITYKVKDPSGNEVISPVTRTVTVNDETAPTLALLGAGTVNLECGTPYNDQGARANDACHGDLTATIERSGTVNVNVPNQYTVVYNVTDPSGQIATPVSRTVNVADTQVPVINVVGPLEQTYRCGTTYDDPGATANDTCAGNLPVVATRTPVAGQPGAVSISYSATDPSGNTATSAVSRTVRMIDEVAPVVVLNGAVTETEECGIPYVDPGASASDTCIAGPLPVTVTGAVDHTTVGTYTLAYSARDSSGNASSPVNRTVMVKDSATPRIACPPAVMALAEDDGLATVTLPMAQAEDSCSEVTLKGPSENRFPVGTTTVTYVATDASGNTAECTSTVVVEGPLSEWDQAFLGGGRGCSATGGGSSLSVMGLLALVARLARRRQQPVLPGQLAVARPVSARVLALAVLLLGAAAFAQPSPLPEFELERLKLNPSGLGSLLVGTGELLPERGYRLALTTHYENDPLVLYQNGTRQGVVVRHRATAHLSVAYGLWKRVELGAQVPLVLLQRGDDLAARNVGSPRGGMALGTPLLSARLRLLSERNEDAMDLAVGILVGPRIGQAGALARELRALPSVMVGRRFGSLRGGLDAGLFLRPRTILSEDAKIQDELGHALRLGATLATTGEKLRGELAVIAAVPLKREGYSVETLAGVRLPLSASTEAYGLTGLGYGNAPGTPDFRVLLGVAYGRTKASHVASRPPEPPSSSPLAFNEEGPLDLDGDELLDGPPRDADGDTVWDYQDNCPSEPGPADNQGCPVEEKQLVAIQKDRIEIRDTVHFDFDKATIQPRSFPLLDQVARVLIEHPEIVMVTIEGHTDGRGTAEYNRELSQRRAEAVREYFIQKGVARERMEARGFGEDRPLRSNDTDEGRAANRRVEFITRYAQGAQ